MINQSTQAWQGRSQEFHDRLSHTLVRRMAVTLSEPSPAPGEELPLLWHWAFFQDPAPEAGLGSDGHPARGGFLPPANNRHRMWAGSRMAFYQPLRVDADVMRRSTILNVEEKQGRTGSLLFVTVLHEYLQDGQCALREEQDIVYREPTSPKRGGTGQLPQSHWQDDVVPTHTLLFRYSAVTFNGHRIHYDWPYVTDVEGYPGLVVHGPLIATLNLRAFQRANPGARVKRFDFRGLRPLIAPHAFVVGGHLLQEGKAHLWAGNESGMAQTAEVEFTLENGQ